MAHGHGLDLIVRHVHGRPPDALVQLLELRARLDAKRGIEVGQRLIHEEHRGLASDGPADRDALALTTGELLRFALQELLQSEHVGDLADAPVDLGLRHAAELQTEGDVVVDGHVRIERVVLEHHRDVAILRRDVVHEPLADEDVTGRLLLEPSDHPQRRGLPAAGWSDEHEELFVLNLKRQVIDGEDVSELLRHVVERDRGHSSPPTCLNGQSMSWEVGLESRERGPRTALVGRSEIRPHADRVGA